MKFRFFTAFMCCKASFVVGEISANFGFGKAKRVA